jgi:hypothetical protein
MSVFLENAMFYQGKKNWEDISYKDSTDAILVPNWSPIRKAAFDRIGAEKKNMFRRVYADDGYSIYFRYPDSDKLGFVDRRGSSITNIFP